MDRLLGLWAREPALVTQVVTQALALLVAFGVPVAADQRTAIVGLVEAVGAILAGLVIRSQVWSPASAVARGMSPATTATPAMATDGI